MFWPAADRFLLVKNHRGHGLLEVRELLPGGLAPAAVAEAGGGGGGGVRPLRPGCMLTAIGEQSVVGWRAHDTLQCLEARQAERPLALHFQAPAAAQEDAPGLKCEGSLWVVVAPCGAAATAELEVSPAWQDTPAVLLAPGQTVAVTEIKSTSWGQQRVRGLAAEPPDEEPAAGVGGGLGAADTGGDAAEEVAAAAAAGKEVAGGWISLVSAGGGRLIEPIALHLGNTLVSLQKLVLAIVAGLSRSALASPALLDDWELVARRAAAALADGVSEGSRAGVQAAPTAVALIDGYTELLFRLSMVPELQPAVVKVRDTCVRAWG